MTALQIDLLFADWRPVLGYEGLYSVDVDSGRVRSHRGKGRVLSPWTNKKGYQRVKLYRDSAYRNKRVHVIVLDALFGPCPAGLETRHWDASSHAVFPSTVSDICRGKSYARVAP